MTAPPPQWGERTPETSSERFLDPPGEFLRITEKRDPPRPQDVHYGGDNQRIVVRCHGSTNRCNQVIERGRDGSRYGCLHPRCLHRTTQRRLDWLNHALHTFSPVSPLPTPVGFFHDHHPHALEPPGDASPLLTSCLRLAACVPGVCLWLSQEANASYTTARVLPLLLRGDRSASRRCAPRSLLPTTAASSAGRPRCRAPLPQVTARLESPTAQRSRPACVPARRRRAGQPSSLPAVRQRPA